MLVIMEYIVDQFIIRLRTDMSKWGSQHVMVSERNRPTEEAWHSCNPARLKWHMTIFSRMQPVKQHLSRWHLTLLLVPDSSLQAAEDASDSSYLCFLFADPAAWNSLPASLQDICDHQAFRRNLETVPFNRVNTTLDCLFVMRYWSVVTYGVSGAQETWTWTWLNYCLTLIW